MATFLSLSLSLPLSLSLSLPLPLWCARMVVSRASLFIHPHLRSGSATSLGGNRVAGASSSSLLCNSEKKTKGQQLKGKIVSELFTPLHSFAHFFRIFSPGLSPSKQRALAQGEQKRGKDNKNNRTNRCCTLVVARLSSYCVIDSLSGSAHRNRSGFCDSRLRCPSRIPEIAAISETRQSSAALQFKGAMESR